MEEAGDGLHVVVFPWLAFGHMIPYLELAKGLAARGHAVTFVSTPRNVSRLPAFPANLSARFRFVALPLPKVEGLPEGAESTADVQPEKNDLVKKAFDGLAGPFAAFLAEACAGGGKGGEGLERRPDWIIHDFCHHWLYPIAEKHKMPCALFHIVTATMLAFLGPRWANTAHPRTAAEDFTSPPKWIPFPSTIAYRRHDLEWIAGAFLPNASGVSDIDRLWQIHEHCRLTIYRSCPEVEPGLFSLLTDLFNKPAIPAGLLLPPDLPADDGNNSDIMQWLDDQPPKSVIYVALGSEAPLTAKNLHELALGLELAGVRFMWALRKPAGMFNGDTGGEGELLPKGFEARTRGRGVVCMGWVPQMRVLAHGAVGAFLTHCGWGSTIENMRFGHPLVMLPFIIDQGLIAQAMAARGVGVEISRNDTDGSFERHSVEKAVRLIMVDEEGKVFASNAKKLQEVVADRARQERYVDELVGYLKRYKDGNC